MTDDDDRPGLSRLARRFVARPVPEAGQANGTLLVAPPEHPAVATTQAVTPRATGAYAAPAAAPSGPSYGPTYGPSSGPSYGPPTTSSPSGQPPFHGGSMSKQDELGRVIAGVRRSIPELYGVMVASTDGLSIAHDFPEHEAEKVAAMAATALGLGRRITERTNLGGLQEAVVRGDQGYVVVYGAGESAVLVMSGPPHANLGLMRIEARTATLDVRHVLG